MFKKTNEINTVALLSAIQSELKIQCPTLTYNEKLCDTLINASKKIASECRRAKVRSEFDAHLLWVTYEIGRASQAFNTTIGTPPRDESVRFQDDTAKTIYQILSYVRIVSGSSYFDGLLEINERGQWSLSKTARQLIGAGDE